MKNKILLLSLLAGFLAYGQWTENYAENTLVSNSNTNDIQSLGSSDGKTYVVFWEDVTPFVLKAQLLDVDGTQMWGSDGIVINNTAEMSTYTVTRDQVLDTDGNLFISFTATESTNGYVHKISATGEQLWGNEGVNLGPNAFDTKILPTNDGGAIIGWVDFSTNRGKLQKFDSSGNPLWSNTVTVDVNNSATTVGEMALLSDGSFVVIAHSILSGVNSNLYAQRYSGNGDEIWEAPIQISENRTAYNRRYQLTQDGDDLFLGYFSVANDRFDSYLQRINADGTTPWGMNGASFRTTDDLFEGPTSIASEASSEYVWAIAQFSDSSQTLYGEYVQKFNKQTGERIFGDESKEIFALNGDMYIHKGHLQLLNDMPFFLFSKGFDNGATPIELAVTHLDENGDFVWDEQSITIATSQTSKSRVGFSKNVEGQSVATWVESRDGSTIKAYAQNFIVEDEVMGTTDLNQNNLVYYPNPVKDILKVSSKKAIKNISFTNMAGQIVLKADSLSNNQINLSVLAPAVYVARVTFENGTVETFKIIKQ